MSEAPLLSRWIDHIFDHSVSDPAWHWSADAPAWEGSPQQNAIFIAETFENSGRLLAKFTDEQMNQGFWYLVSIAASDLMRCLIDSNGKVSLELRLRVLRSFVPLFEQIMAVRCSEHLSHLDEQPANPLNSACYMWWDIMYLCGHPEEPAHAEFDSEVLVVLRRLLAIPHNACRESALHGIGEWACYYPNVATIVEDFLAQNTGLRPELVAYAEHAKVGDVL